MNIKQWLSYDMVCSMDSPSDCEICLECRFRDACRFPYYLNHEVVSDLLEMSTQEEISEYIEHLRNMKAGVRWWLLSCNGQGRKPNEKE